MTLDDFVQATLAELPPLTDEQCARVATLLLPSSSVRTDQSVDDLRTEVA